MSHNELVSIIIPTYNRAELIKDTLDSIIEQTYVNWECLVIDDGSIDDTAKVLAHYINHDVRFRYERRPNELPSGGNAARNYGFRSSKGAFIQWFDDDDVMYPNFLKNRISGFSKGVNFVIGLGLVTDQWLAVVSDMTFDEDVSLFKGVANGRNQLITNSVIFKRSYLKNKDLFNVNLKRGQESELFSRLFFKADKNEYRIVKNPLFLYRQHQSTKTQRNEIYDPEFKQSEAFVAIENLKRSLILGDADLSQFLYRVAINTLFRATENKDYDTAKFILNKLLPIINGINPLLAKKIKVSIKAFSFIGRNSYKWEMYLKNYNLT